MVKRSRRPRTPSDDEEDELNSGLDTFEAMPDGSFRKVINRSSTCGVWRVASEVVQPCVRACCLWAVLTAPLRNSKTRQLAALTMADDYNGTTLRSRPTVQDSRGSMCVVLHSGASSCVPANTTFSWEVLGGS